MDQLYSSNNDVTSGIGHALRLPMLFLVIVFALLFLTIVGVNWAEGTQFGKRFDRGLQSRSKGSRRL
jgi:hypothetical protein